MQFACRTVCLYCSACSLGVIARTDGVWERREAMRQLAELRRRLAQDRYAARRPYQRASATADRLATAGARDDRAAGPDVTVTARKILP